MVARIAPPSALTAVTVAPAIGNFAAFVSLPTMAPADALAAVAVGAAASLANTDGVIKDIDEIRIRR
jgi:hypothetical protein